MAKNIGMNAGGLNITMRIFISRQSSTISNLIGTPQAPCLGTINLLVVDTVTVRFDGV